MGTFLAAVRQGARSAANNVQPTLFVAFLLFFYRIAFTPPVKVPVSKLFGVLLWLRTTDCQLFFLEL